jgi:hypothetical protein
MRPEKSLKKKSTKIPPLLSLKSMFLSDKW